MRSPLRKTFDLLTGRAGWYDDTVIYHYLCGTRHELAGPCPAERKRCRT